jgi:hypothetical protein
VERVYDSKQKVIVEPAHMILYGVAENDEKNSPSLDGIDPAVPRCANGRIAVGIPAKPVISSNF